jgi:chromosome segregation ATPase
MSRRIRVFVLGFLASGLVVGCTERDRDDAIDQGAAITKHVVNSTVSAASEAWERASAEAKKLTPDSGREALESAEKGLDEAKDRLQPGKRVKEAEAEIARLRAALDIDRLRLQMDAKVAEAERLKENADKSAEEVRRQLAAADRAYRDLNDRLEAAQEAYDTAKRKVDAISDSIVK